VAYLDAGMNFFNVNRAYAEAEGKTPEYFLGKNHFELFPDKENENFFKEVISSGKPHFASAKEFVYRNNPEKGVTYWDWSLMPTFDKEGKVNGLVVTLLDITARVKSEQALTVSEQRFRELAETIKEVFWLVDWESKKSLYISPAYWEIFGQDVTTIMDNSTSWMDQIHPEDREFVERQFNAGAEAGNFNVEFKIVHPDQKVRWVHARAFPIIQGNKVTRMAGYMVDVTDRKVMEQNLQFATNIINRVSSLIVVVNKKGAFIYVSPSSKALLNFESEELLGYKWWIKTSLNTEQQNKERVRIMRVLESGVTFKDRYHEQMVKTKDGVIRWIAWEFTETSDGLLIGVGQDITQRKAAEKMLVASEYKYKHLFEQMGEGIMLTDREGNIVISNKAFSNITGYSAHELIGKNAYELLVYDDDKLMAQKKTKKRIAGETEQYELRMVTKNNSTIWVRISSSPNLDEDMNFAGVMLIVSDITHIKEAELKLQLEKRQGMQYQSMLLSSQINPHFIFNALNSIQYYILEQKTVPAMDFVSEFARLMRTTLENSLHKQISLFDEINFLKLYLELERKRYNNIFQYEINFSEHLDPNDFYIPPMLLQPYLENTVVHGLSSLEKNGKVIIDFEMAEDQLICTITDNGVGRKRAMELRKLRFGHSHHRSLGMNILDTRFKLLNELTGKKYHVEVNDLENTEGDGVGTQIRIQMPVITEDSEVWEEN
jgi:PAS domain S-box-containing protein